MAGRGGYRKLVQFLACNIVLIIHLLASIVVTRVLQDKYAQTFYSNMKFIIEWKFLYHVKPLMMVLRLEWKVRQKFEHYYTTEDLLSEINNFNHKAV